MKANQKVIDGEGIVWEVLSVRKNDGKVFHQRWEDFRVVTLVASGIDAECSELAAIHDGLPGRVGGKKVTFVYLREDDASQLLRQ